MAFKKWSRGTFNRSRKPRATRGPFHRFAPGEFFKIHNRQKTLTDQYQAALYWIWQANISDS